MFSWRQKKCFKHICDLQECEKGKIVQIRGKVAEHRYLSILGIAVGQDIFVEKVIDTPRERIITIATSDIDITLDRTLTHNIQVEVPLVSS